LASRAVKRRLAEDVALWQADGLVPEEAARVLRERYDVAGVGLASVARTLGIIGALVAGFGILGALAATSGSLVLATVELVAVAAGFLRWGLRLARDPRGRSPGSARALLAIGTFALAGAGAAAAGAADAGGGTALVLAGLASVPVALALAYRFRIGFLLVLGLLGLFHWIGSWHSMVGRSTYAFEIQDPRLMAVAALGAVAVGLLHRRGKLPGPAGFDAAWLSLGLLYLDLSLLVLTVAERGASALGWIAAALAAALLQVLAGAREKSALLLGFGVTAFGVNLFTRYYETFWDGWDKGIFLLLGGVLLMGFGAGCERLLRRADLSPAAAGEAAP
jgi:uncharacterized membrane protein